MTTYGRGLHNRFILPAEYVDAVRRAGGIPLLLPPGEERLDAILPLLKAVVFTGGGDIDPDLYGGSHHESIYMVEPERDRTEVEWAQRVFDLGVPTLAICRGAQLLNVSKGGTLIEHLPDVVGETVIHRAPPREPVAHPVRVLPEFTAGRRPGELPTFRACLGTTRPFAKWRPDSRSWRHAPDGTIEGLEMQSHPWLVAVQWHPELTAAEDPIQQRLFDALVEAAVAR